MDGTRRKLLHEEQLQVLVCLSKYSLIDGDTGTRLSELTENWGNVFRIEGHSAGHTHALALEQLESLHVPTWLNQEALDAQLAELDEVSKTFWGWKDLEPKWYSIYCCSTDN